MQWNLSFETPLYKVWSRKNVHIMFVTSIKGTPVFRKKGHLFWVLKPRFNLHSGDTLGHKKLLTTRVIDKFKSSLVTMATAFKTQTISLKSIYYTCGNSTHNISWPAPFYTSYISLVPFNLHFHCFQGYGHCYVTIPIVFPANHKQSF